MDGDLLSYKIHKSSWLSERTREKIKCELPLWLCPLMSSLFLLLLSYPTLGSRERERESLHPLARPRKTRPHSYAHPDLSSLTRQSPAAIELQGVSWTHTSRLKFILGKARRCIDIIGYCNNPLFPGGENDWKKARWRTASKTRMRANRPKTERSKVSKWGLSLTGLLEAPDCVLWFVTTWFQRSRWETFKHTYTRRSCGERLSAYLFGEPSKWFPLPSFSQTLNC